MKQFSIAHVARSSHPIICDNNDDINDQIGKSLSYQCFVSKCTQCTLCTRTRSHRDGFGLVWFGSVVFKTINLFMTRATHPLSFDTPPAVYPQWQRLATVTVSLLCRRRRRCRASCIVRLLLLVQLALIIRSKNTNSNIA